MMKTLTTNQRKDRLNFIKKYIQATNPASGSEVDANSNVTQKTIATLEAEIYKRYTVALNRELVKDKLRRKYNNYIANVYDSCLDNHLIYVHDESTLKPYCASITLYPFLLEGTKCIGGVSKAPKNLQSFCGGFVNLVYQVASNFAGAVATVEFLHYFDYFARNQYGLQYLQTHEKEIKQELQGVVYALNQPASARGDQSIFWNISIFDKYYLQEMFGEFYYPDGTQVDMESTLRLQNYFMSWLREERKKELLTFPVVTSALLTEEGKVKDTDLHNFLAKEMSLGNSFFVYMSDRVDSLASCCRLRNELVDNTFSYSLGAGGVVAGSAQVITLNLYRLVREVDDREYIEEEFLNLLHDLIINVQGFLVAHRDIYQEYIDAGLLPAYTAGFMSLDRQFLTLGINGLVECAEYLGYTISDNKEYKRFLARVLDTFSNLNREAYKVYGVRFNTELVPAENLGVKNAKWDKEAGYHVERDCYNSYFYLPEDEDSTILDKIALHSGEHMDNLDGGSALHLNLEQLPDEKQAYDLLALCAKKGVPYFTTNTRCTICNDCDTICPETLNHCKACGSTNVEYGTRIIGYLKRISNFSEERKKEALKRKYH